MKIDGNTIGMADVYEGWWEYPVADRPTFGSMIPAYLTQYFRGELRIEGLWTTDNVLHQNTVPSGGDLPVKTITLEETDTTSPTPVKKTTTIPGRQMRFEKTGRADQFSQFRLTLKMNAQPTIA